MRCPFLFRLISTLLIGLFLSGCSRSDEPPSFDEPTESVSPEVTTGTQAPLGQASGSSVATGGSPVPFESSSDSPSTEGLETPSSETSETPTSDSSGDARDPGAESSKSVESATTDTEEVEVLPIYRSQRLGGGDYFYSTAKEPGVTPYYIWNNDVAFKTLRKRASEDMVPLVQCYNGISHYLVVDEGSACGVLPVDRFLGFIFKNEVSDTLALDRYSQIIVGAISYPYLSTIDITDEDSTSLRFNNRMGYALSDDYAKSSYTVTVTSKPVAAQLSIYRASQDRLYNPGVDWFYSTANEADGYYYVSDGVKFVTYDKPMDMDMVQLVQCYDSASEHRLSSTGCNGQPYDRALGYIYATSQPGTIPLYNYFDWAWWRYLATTNLAAEVLQPFLLPYYGYVLHLDYLRPILGYVPSP